jgi:hypothetical protein
MHIMDSKKPLYKSIPFWIMVLFLLYSALGFLAVPYYIKKQLFELSKSEYNSKLMVDEVSFNPYTIAINISGISLIDSDRTQWFKADQIDANLDFWKTLFSHYSLSKIHLENPQYQLTYDHTRNDVSIKYPKFSNTSPQSNETELYLDINDLSINQGSISYIDGSAEHAINLNFDNIKLQQSAFSTKDTNIPFKLSFTTESKYSTEIAGFYNIPKSHIDVDWKVKNWATTTLIKLLNKGDDIILGLTNNAGYIDAYGHLNYSTFGTEESSILIQQLLLNGFESAASTEDTLKFQLPRLHVTNAAVNLNKQNISIERIDTNQISISLGLSDENELLWRPLVNKLGNKPVSQTSVNAWQLSLQNLNIKDSKVSVSKPSGENILHLEHLNIKNFSNVKGRQSEIFLVGSIDYPGQIKALSQFQLSPLELSTELKLNNINLSKWQTWVPKSVPINIQKGLLTTVQNISVKNANIISQGWVKLENTTFVDNTNHEFFSIEQLLIEKNNVNVNNKSIELDKITLDHAYGDLLVSENNPLNITNTISDSRHETSEKVSKQWSVLIKSDVKEILNPVSTTRAHTVQTQLIDQLSVPTKRTLMRTSEVSENLNLQVKIGIANL